MKAAQAEPPRVLPSGAEWRPALKADREACKEFSCCAANAPAWQRMVQSYLRDRAIADVNGGRADYDQRMLLVSVPGAKSFPAGIVVHGLAPDFAEFLDVESVRLVLAFAVDLSQQKERLADETRVSRAVLDAAHADMEERGVPEAVAAQVHVENHASRKVLTEAGYKDLGKDPKDANYDILGRFLA